MTSVCSICGKFDNVGGIAQKELLCFSCLDWLRKVSDMLIDKILYRR